MEERKGDARIFIISGLIFLCIISGGILLCLYLFLPESQTPDWYPIVGIVLVSTPWIFWLSIYFYHCLKPTKVQLNAFGPNNNNSHSKKTEAANYNDGGATIEGNLGEVESPGEGKRRVHFGAVVVMEKQPQLDRNYSHESQSKQPTTMSPRETEVPLRSSTSSS
ncbi:uncharacterized protein LOC120068181 [Benincasa hispida]|uniref:uncharacterized protein LOC120068181 n=1 Tax=Benincasa hispida TaxID=102211 RepID=UPI0019015F22|nr:uncharacterized protein LOC120068181 [Benincasa hispida]